MKLAVVMPVLNEALAMPGAIAALAELRARGAALIVVDGGSADGTAQAAELARADAVLVAPRGRASQMNAGAGHPLARRADVLLFLHADTRLPPGADGLIIKALLGRAAWGRFDVRIEGHHPLLPMVAALMNARSRRTGIATGDQAVFVRRRVWESLGGFAAQPLMEDIELSQRLCSLSAPVCLKERVTTAGRRWDHKGFWRTVLLMWRLRAAYAWGASAHHLAMRYGYTPRAAANVVIMAKAPVPGFAKTRLIPLLGKGGAARAQRGFVLKTLLTVHRASLGPFQLHGALSTQNRLFGVLAERFAVPCLAQVEGDIGARMAAVMAAHFAAPNAMPLLIVGTDCPALTPAHLQAAADALVAHDAVFIPAEDGGYVLIGMRRPLPVAFERIEWSTARTMAQTRERLSEARVPWIELPALWDVDEPADWQRWKTVEPRDGL
ncbi:MAG: TIGR04283 family arsenosugar biosynthesis glycosyltransferase [Hydrogenophaga sp.]